MAAENRSEQAMQQFLARVWRDDVGPLLRGRHAAQRRTGARVGGTLAGGAGAVLDGLFRLRGRPFTRALTVLGARLGAIAPDAWTWEWLRSDADAAQRRAVAEGVERQSGGLSDEEALALLDLDPRSTRQELQNAWRAVLLRWHPDRAPDEPRRAEYRVRFLAYQGAYERVRAAFEAGKLPRE